ncbi:MAG: CBS domain-containing protein [Candidatus Marinimicrobia bacterium]|nr:CBS domain-containing protein [Candidatus Neomarinimicrobiota bacterium]
MKVSDILKEKGSDVVMVKRTEMVCDTVKLMNAQKIGSVIVLDEKGNIAGIMTERDILSCPFKEMDIATKKVFEVMTPSDRLIIASAEDNIQYVMAMMTEHRIKHMPVMKNDQLVGLISIGDVVKALLDRSQQETKRLQDYIAGKYPEE